MAEPISIGLLGATIAIKAVSLIGAGFALSLGFWGGKRLTNRLDYFIYTHSKAYREDQKNVSSHQK